MSENRKGEWLNIDVLAKAAGLNRSTVGRRVARFDREGLVTVRRVDGRKMIEKGAYDRACEISIDAVQSINASGRKRAKGKRPAGDPGELAKEQARRARYQGDLLELRLAELRRTLIPAAEVEEAMARAMGELVRVLNAMPNRAPEIVAACERDGGGGTSDAQGAQGSRLRYTEITCGLDEDA